MSKIHCQEFHELAMDYRGAPLGNGRAQYDALCAYVERLVDGTLLDHFAGQALPALIVACMDGTFEPKHPGPITEDDIASEAYSLGRAMLRQRAKAAS